MTVINYYCEDCDTWQKVDVMDINYQMNTITLYLSCGHIKMLVGAFAVTSKFNISKRTRKA